VLFLQCPLHAVSLTFTLILNTVCVCVCVYWEPDYEVFLLMRPDRGKEKTSNKQKEQSCLRDSCVVIRAVKQSKIKVCVYIIYVGIVYNYFVYIRAVKRLIAINHIQNKSLCLHNICGCTVYNYFVYI